MLESKNGYPTLQNFNNLVIIIDPYLNLNKTHIEGKK